MKINVNMQNLKNYKRILQTLSVQKHFTCCFFLLINTKTLDVRYEVIEQIYFFFYYFKNWFTFTGENNEVSGNFENEVVQMRL